VSRFELDHWDEGKLVVNHAFANLLRRQHWTTFAVIWSRTAEAAVAKNLRTDRVTLRFTLDDAGHERTFYIKRHGRSSLKEYIKPLLSLRWPILGARNEWNALLAFHDAGLPTMTPVAFGQSGANSFLITEALENCTKLSELERAPAITDPSMGDTDVVAGASHRHDTATLPALARQSAPRPVPDRRSLVKRVARTTQRMHQAGLHHQDYYLGHLLLPNRQGTGEASDRIYVIDLGRVRRQKPLSRRWIVKDLAQLNYSAHGASVTERIRFLREYLGRRICRADKRLIAAIATKTAAIARHSRKNSL
jgi:heptose I phosphotransferase